VSVDLKQLAQWRLVDELTIPEIASKLGLTTWQARKLLDTNGIALSGDALKRAHVKGTAKGREAARAKAPNAAQKAWGTGRYASRIEGAGEPVVPPGPRPKIVGTDLAEMIARALAAGYPVTVAPPCHADGSKRLAFGQEVG
jgi:hypothetical protein